MPDPVMVAKTVPALARAGGGLWRWWRPDTSYTALTTHADDLADAVRLSEIPRLEQLGVTRGAAMDLSYRALVRARAAGGADLGTLEEVGNYYRTLEPGRLVVLGEPGAGKTVLGLHLLLDLIEHRHDGPGEARPVPLRVNAASWDPATDFTRWLAGALATDYSLRPHLARGMIAGRRILPVLDGLDEMDPLGVPPRRARAALDQLNQPPWRGRPLIVTCRTTTYDEICELRRHGPDAGLHDATAVTVRPLTTEEILGHLDRCRQAEGIPAASWAPVADSLIAQPAGSWAGSRPDSRARSRAGSWAGSHTGARAGSRARPRPGA